MWLPFIHFPNCLSAQGLWKCWSQSLLMQIYSSKWMHHCSPFIPSTPLKTVCRSIHKCIMRQRDPGHKHVKDSPPLLLKIKTPRLKSLKEIQVILHTFLLILCLFMIVFNLLVVWLTFRQELSHLLTHTGFGPQAAWLLWFRMLLV